MELIYTNDLCTGCNKCVRNCPVLTANVATEVGKVMVDGDKCIACGECFDACPHNARDYYDDTDKFFDDLARGKKISVNCRISEKKGRESYMQCVVWGGYYYVGISKVYYGA